METTHRKRADDSIRLTLEGQWYHGEFPILHERTIQFLNRNICLDADNKYYLSGEDKPVYIKIEDVPFFITHLEKTIAGYLVTLSDGSIELLNMNVMWVGKNNEALYCTVKGGEMPAKFNRTCYYEMMQSLVHEGPKYFIQFGSKKFELGKTPPPDLIWPEGHMYFKKPAAAVSAKSNKKSAAKKPAKKAVGKKVSKKPASKPKAKKPALKKAAKVKKPAAKKKPAKKKKR